MPVKAPFQNQVALAAERLQELQKHLVDLRDFGNALYEMTLTYVLDGDDEGVLAVMAAQPQAASALGLGCSSPNGFGSGYARWHDFLRTIEPVDCRFYLRLGKVLEAAAKSVATSHFCGAWWFDGAIWLELLLQEGTRTIPSGWSSSQTRTAISGQLIEEMLAADGRDPTVFVRSAFAADNKRWENTRMRQMVLSASGLAESFARHSDVIVPFLTQGPAEQRLIAVQNLLSAQAPLAPFAREIALCASDTSKLLRESAETFLRSDPAAACPHLLQLAQQGNRGQREHAIRNFGRLNHPESRKSLESLATTEKAGSVRELIATVLNDLDLQAAPSGVAQLTLPPHEPLPLNVPITESLRAVLSRMLDEYNALAAQHNQNLTNLAANRFIHPKTPLRALDQSDLGHICRLLEEGGRVRGTFKETLGATRVLWASPKGAYRTFLEHPDCRLIHVVRLMAAANQITAPHERNGGLTWSGVQEIDLFRRAHSEPVVTLRHLADAIQSLGLPDDMLLKYDLRCWGRIFDWETEAVWPYYFERLDQLRVAFEPPTGNDYFARHHRQAEFLGALRVLMKFPQLPPLLAGQIWDLAVGTNREHRLRAQPVAAKLPDLLDRLAKSLGSGNYQTRSATADWMGRLGDPRAVPLLDAAARKEKQDVALDEILTALERLGQPIEPYLDRDRLAKDAAKGLKKGVPEALNWFPWTNLPTVHWQDSGEAVPRDVVTWLLVQNFKLKSSEAGPLLRRYCGMIVPSEREVLGEFILNAWLAQDLKCNHTDAQARKLAQQRAPAGLQQYQQLARWYQQRGEPVPPYLNATLPQMEEVIYQQLLRECGSAVKEKGMLAVAGACCGPAAVAPVQKYLKEWYGYRAAQCKALIAMLSTIDHPSAIQYLLSIANRFRTKGIREEAEKYVRRLAERKGWTLDELADRTMPTAGLDDDGTLTLDFGPRQFTLRVNADLEPVLTDGDGKVLKSLPAPRKDDDAEQAKAAKKAFSTAKSELQKFAGMQRTRLYEAMCTQRTWPVADWRAFLVGHPLMRFLCQRLVWSSWTGGELQQTFRPLDDGTLTDASDTEITLADDAAIRIAHECEGPPDVTAAWVRHLADYDVSPLFTQFGRGDWRLPDEKRRETALDDFQGHLVEAFKLRGLATKFGYTRGQTQDGGWFYDYTKAFPGLELDVQLGFSGNGLPEENRTVALTSLTFRRKSGEGASIWNSDGGLPLRDVPAILLSECYHDLRTIAATGNGFDPEWEKKVHG